MLLNETTFTFLDVETTGLFPQFGDRICEIALLKWRDGKELGSFESLVRPGRPISPGAHAVNRITDEMVADAPHFGDVLQNILSLTDKAVIVGHNIPFDLGFLANQMIELGEPPLRNRVVDTLALARMQYSFRRNSLQSIISSLGFSLKSYHRAMADVMATKLLFEYFLDDFDARGVETLEQLIQLQGQTILPPKLDKPPLPPGLEEAMKTHKPVTIRYMSSDGQKTVRTIEPLDVTSSQDYDYLLAFCYLRQEERTFRLDRILEILPEQRDSVEPTAPTAPIGQASSIDGAGSPLTREVTTTDKAQPDFDFKVMSLTYKFRDLFSPPSNILEEAGIEQGLHVLDYGCGPGSYIVPLQRLVGDSGKIYALDIHPLAIQKVQRIASKKHLRNVEAIQSDCKTGLPDNSVDMVLLYDTLHDLADPDGVLKELHRVLKPGGILSLTDHHLKENEILSRVTNRGLFRLSKKGKKTYTFSKGDSS